MKLKTLALSLLLGFAATSAFAEDQYIVRVPANVNLAAATPETPAEPLSVVLSAEALPAGMVGTPYEFNLLDRLTITGGTGAHNYSDTNWSLKTGDALPPGLAIEGDKIVGTPTVKNEAGTSFEVTGTYQDASGKQVYSIVVDGIALQVKQVSAGSQHTCAITIDGGVKCWGYSGNGQIGDAPYNTNIVAPYEIAGLDGVRELFVGWSHNCAIMNNGAAKCWGINNEKQSAPSSTDSYVKTATEVTISGKAFKKFALGASHTCALTTDKEVYCWGYNNKGQVGDGTTTSRNNPVRVQNLEANIHQLTAGWDYTCALSESGDAKCWGNNEYGQLGDGSQMNVRLLPVNVVAESGSISSIDVQHTHSCLVTKTGAVKCWGSNYYYQLGTNDKIDRSLPALVQGLDSAVQSVSLGSSNTCVHMISGEVNCWGYIATGLNEWNALSSSPLIIGTGFSGFSYGISHGCAIKGQSLKCWGNNSYGQLGDGTTTNRSTLVDVLP